MSRGILAKTRNIQFHENVFSISPVVTLRRCTERKKGTNYQLRSFLSRTHPNRQTVYVYCCWLLLTKRHSACHVQRLTAQHIYCTNTIQTVESTTEMYLYRNYSYMFSCTTEQNMYCTNTVQTVQYTTELYLQ